MSGTVCCFGEMICKQDTIILGVESLCCKGKQACFKVDVSASVTGTNTVMCDGDQACKLANFAGLGEEDHCCTGGTGQDEACFDAVWPPS